MTDHRVGLTTHNLPAVLGGEGLDEIIDAVATSEQARILSTEAYDRSLPAVGEEQRV